jgi:CYTH domain-containing protein
VKPAVGAVKRCKKLQDVLGDLNDTHVLRDDLGVALAEAATEQARELHRLVEEEDPAAVRRQMRRSPRSGLLEVIRRDHARTRALFEELESDWVETGAAPLRKAVERVAVRLEAAAQEGEEIERKFLLNALPVPPETPEVLEIDQGWLPGKDIKERIRRVQANGASHYVRTIKMGQGIRRTEVEEPITESLFQALWPLTEGRRIRKIRRRIPDGERTWEVDEFLDRDLVVAEVELSDVTEEVVLPEWLAPTVVRDVTDEPGYTNYELAT